MEKTHIYKPDGVCSREMKIVYDDETMKVLQYVSVRGCAGNSQGVGALIQGMDIKEALTRLRGIRCPGGKRGLTSCPDQLSYGLEEILKLEGKEI